VLAAKRVMRQSLLDGNRPDVDGGLQVAYARNPVLTSLVVMTTSVVALIVAIVALVFAIT
jgi:hypothetical protein